MFQHTIISDTYLHITTGTWVNISIKTFPIKIKRLSFSGGSHCLSQMNQIAVYRKVVFNAGRLRKVGYLRHSILAWIQWWWLKNVVTWVSLGHQSKVKPSELTAAFVEWMSMFFVVHDSQDTDRMAIFIDAIKASLFGTFTHSLWYF